MQAFSYCSSLTSVTIPNSVTSIGYSAFYYCTQLATINVDNANVNYSSEAGVLYNKNKTVLMQYPGGKQGAFIIPNSVTSIGASAFSYCSSLTSVTIPNSVTSIGVQAFSSCSSLASVHVKWNNPSQVTIDNSAFYSTSSNKKLYVPSGTISLYQAVEPWRSFSSIIEE
jgi:hypothetical protein